MASSVIRGYWYDSHREVLDVLFATGRRYRYRQVPADLVERLRASPSLGQFFNAELRGRFECEEIGRTRRWGERLER